MSLERLRELHERATKEWRAESSPAYIVGIREGGINVDVCTDQFMRAEDRELIVALRNAAPHLLDVLEAARQVPCDCWGAGVCFVCTTLTPALERLEGLE